MIGDEQIEKAIGTIDGFNTSFTTPHNFQADSLQVFKNGQKIDSVDDDGPTVTGSNSFSLGQAPLNGDKIFVRYLEA